MTAPMDEQQLAEIRALADRATARPFLLSDCEGELKVWAESALKHVTRDETGAITGWSEPGSFTACDLVAQVELDMGTWDPGEDMDDDQRRQDVADLVGARDALPALLARVAELETERHSTNEALSDAAEALREKEQQLADALAERADRHDDLAGALGYANEDWADLISIAAANTATIARGGAS